MFHSLCDMCYVSHNECERYFVILFKKLGELQLPQKNDIILNIYFPLYKSYQHSKILNRCFTSENAFSIIANLNSIDSKINYFNIFRNNFNIDEIKERDVIKLYNSLYLGYLIQKNDISTEIISMFNFFISYFIKSVGNKKKTFASPLLIIDSFFETFLLYGQHRYTGNPLFADTSDTRSPTCYNSHNHSMDNALYTANNHVMSKQFFYYFFLNNQIIL